MLKELHCVLLRCLQTRSAKDHAGFVASILNAARHSYRCWGTIPDRDGMDLIGSNECFGRGLSLVEVILGKRYPTKGQRMP